MARPKAPASDTRSRILAAAADEFGARGFAATTVDRIARRARVNKAMIYYHFPNKRALYTCIIRDLFAPIAEPLAAMAADAPRRRQARPPDRNARAVDRRSRRTFCRSSCARSPMAARISAPRSWPARRHLRRRPRRHRRGRRTEDLSAGSSGARALHPHCAARHVPRDGARARADQGRPARRHPGRRFGHVVRHLQMVARRMLAAADDGRQAAEGREQRARAESRQTL